MSKIHSKDNLTGLWTPYGEKLQLGESPLIGEIYVDWDDMHSAYRRYGDENVARELRRVSDFLKRIFQKVPKTYLTYISGDNIRICSTQLNDDELLNILYAHGQDFEGIAKLVCGRGFPDPLTKEVFEYWQQHPERRFQLFYPINGQNVCTLDLRHLRKITEMAGMETIEDEITKFTGMLQQHFSPDKIYRTRCDEIWTFSYLPVVELENRMEGFANTYNGVLEFDWGVGKNLPEAHEDLKRRKDEPSVVRTKKGDYVLVK